MPSILILGEHDKGFGEPFSLKTLSGKRLRAALSEFGVDAKLGNVFDYDHGTVTERNLRVACAGCQVVIALGKVAAAECERQQIDYQYLPHPAVRSTLLLGKLRTGLQRLKSL